MLTGLLSLPANNTTGNKKMRTLLYIGILFGCLIPLRSVQGQTAGHTRICDTIRYEFIRDKIIIPVTVNGVRVKYIVDTGGQTATVRQAAAGMKAVSAGSQGISDLNNIRSIYEKGILEDVRLSGNYRLNRLESLIVPANGFFTELGVAGILGGDAFNRAVITFDARQQIMIIHYPYRPAGLKISDGIGFLPEAGNHSIVSARIGGTEVPVLFDTGASGLLLLSYKDFQKLSAEQKAVSVSEASGISGVGLSGPGKAVKTAKVTVGELDFAGKHFVNAGSITIPMGKSIIGVEMLRYGRVTIDYPRKRFYFFPFGEETTDLGGAPVTWNVAILPVGDHFEISMVWESLKEKVIFGTQVVNINGTDLSGIQPSQFEIERILNDIPGNSAYIVIRKDGKEEKIAIRRE